MSDKQMLTTKELAVRWSISSNTLQQWRTQGKPPAFVKVNKNIRYRKEDVLAVEKDNRLSQDTHEKGTKEE